MSCLLGSMSADTSCVASFDWMYHGSREYSDLIGQTEEEKSQREYDIQLGQMNILRHSEAIRNIAQSDQSVQKHLYFNQRQYVSSKS